MKTKTVALGGLLLALSMVLLYTAALLPSMRLTLHGAASFLVALMIIERGVKAGWLFYAASSVLGLILIPDKLGFMMYVLCFGLYGLAKYYIERLHKRPLEIILKLLFLNGMLALLFFLFKEAFLGDISMGDRPVYLVFLLLEAVFILYDIAFSMVISVYLKRRR